ncbi:MAG: PEP-CTERM sorting domain-containing protein [Pseudomonadota bacterium]|nr:PEP-CTERM sorting domain-containing protein [Pseudomonadota bacterium]
MPTRTPVRHAALLAGGLAASLLATSAALAGSMSVNYAFNSLKANGDTTCTTGNCILGSNTETYTSNGISLTALSFGINESYPGASQANTWVSQRFGAAGGSEVGLGVASGSDSARNGSSLEIASNEWLVLDVSNLINAGYHNFSLGIGSIQSGEGGQVDVFTPGSGFSGTAGSYSFSPKSLSLLGSATSNTGGALQNIALTGITQDYLVITADNPSAPAGNVLVTNLSATQPATQTPEPGSLALLAAGLAAVGLALGARRRQRG